MCEWKNDEEIRLIQWEWYLLWHELCSLDSQKKGGGNTCGPKEWRRIKRPVMQLECPYSLNRTGSGPAGGTVWCGSSSAFRIVLICAMWTAVCPQVVCCLCGGRLVLVRGSTLRARAWTGTDKQYKLLITWRGSSIRVFPRSVFSWSHPSTHIPTYPYFDVLYGLLAPIKKLPQKPFMSSARRRREEAIWDMMAALREE